MDDLKRQARHWLPTTSLDAAGLIALADLDTIARRTSLIGTAPLVDALIICPGMHRQQKAPDLSKSELPPTAAMTSGYILRVENEATVAYLQRVGVTGKLSTFGVERRRESRFSWLWVSVFGPAESVGSVLLTSIAASGTMAVMIVLAALHDWWGLVIILSLVLSRILNVYIIHRRTKPSWHGALEPGVKGDLLVLLSQDRWVRLQGLVDSLKTVTSGQFLTDKTFVESALESAATMLVYVSAALAGNATQMGKALLVALLLGSVILVGISNECIKSLYVHGQCVSMMGKPKHYARRLDLAKELIEETKRHDWAVGLGMVKAEDYGESTGSVQVTL